MKVISKTPSNLAFPNLLQILIVEDEYVIAANLQENLEALGHSVLDTSSSAEEAIAKARELHPDLVLMDIRLQGEMDGIQAAGQIWQHLQIPVVYVTGHSDKRTLEMAKATSPFGYILKPVKGNDLYVAIEIALTRYEREQFFSTVLQRIGDGVVVVDTEYRVKYLNQVAEILTGWQQSEATDQDFMVVMNLIDETTHQPIENPIQTVFQQDSLIYLTQPLLLITKDGMTVPITDSIASLVDNKGNLTGAVMVFRDDTQRRLQEEHNLITQHAQTLERQREELQRLNQLKDDFLSMVSHELRTPLSNIKMAIRMLEISLDQQAASDITTPPPANRMAHYLRILRDQCNQELSLVNDLLELQQLEAGAHPLALSSIYLDEWIASNIKIFQERAHSRDQQLQAMVPPDLVLISDPGILTRILAELLMNACKYTPPGGEITVTVRAQPKNWIYLIVQNTGVEIPAEQLTRIFDRFYRIPKSDRYQQGGTGLGLALVTKLVSYLGGTIWAESEAGQTCFTVELPSNPPI